MVTKKSIQILVGCFFITALFLGFVMEAKADKLAASPDQNVGTWAKSCLLDTCYMRLYKNGTIHHAATLDSLDSNLFVISSYWFKGTKMFLKDIKYDAAFFKAGGMLSCGKTIGTYEVHLLENGNMKFVAIDDKCMDRKSDMEIEYKPVG